MRKVHYIHAIRKIFQDRYLTKEARAKTEKRFPIGRSPLWKYTIPELKEILRGQQLRI